MSLELETEDPRTLEFKARVFKVLGDSNRIKIMEFLRGGERCQCEVIPILDLTGLLSTRLPATRSVESPPIRMAPPSEPALILLVEDALTTRELERSILEAAGYRVETAFDGLDALQKLEQDDFHLVITDIEMPHMDGFELTVRLRQDPRWSGLPVVIISVREDEESRRMGLQSGAQAYIAKRRFDQSDLLETIAQLVG